ncbi:MAG: DUF58 domain-containing protein [Saprospirales bacterium]|nr:DUF58 domain-containing protein [Saprospirales bacterium]
MKQLYLNNRFFLLFGTVSLLFALSYMLPWLFWVAVASGVLALGLVAVDAWLLFSNPKPILVNRRLPKVMTLGDENLVHITLKNTTNHNYEVELLDELPMQFQQRDASIPLAILPKEKIKVSYPIRPVMRGAYEFGHVNLFISNPWRLAWPVGYLQRRLQLEEPSEIAVYPSVLQMKKYELLALSRLSTQQGLRKIRRIGHSYEFEQIKEYVRGDDYRSVNWKATGRRHRLMVNQYEDERSQQIYSVIDKSRSMRMPFDNMSLLDYAINSTLALSNIALKKYDKAGMITFSDKIGTVLRADRKANQLGKIQELLYKEKERPVEANFELLYYAARKLVNGRSLLLLYTNFESMYALDRALPMLRRMGKLHLLVVIFFVNTEVEKVAYQPAETLEQIYTQAIAQKFLTEKTAMVQKLQQHGIQAVLTRPEELSANTINKYLELKARGLI